MSRPVVTIVGRPNVGKSSLFNRLLGRRKALVQDTPGVTRDRNYAIADIEGREFILCDTGGFEEQAGVADDVMARLIREQALVAIEESDVIVHVMDIRAGLTSSDQEIVQRLRGAGQPVLWTLNKCDHPSVEVSSADFYRLGVEQFFLVSAEHSLGLNDLMDAILAALPQEGAQRGAVEDPFEPKKRRRGSRKKAGEGADDGAEEEGIRADKGGRLYFIADDMPAESVTRRGPAPQEWDPQPAPVAEEEAAFDLLAAEVLDDEGHPVQPLHIEDLEHFDWSADELPEGVEEFEASETDGWTPRIAILGRPNVGKSTLLNRLLGYQRSITSPLAGTTHDTVDAFLEHEGQRYVLIDTAGVRKRRKIVERVEKMTVGRSIRTIEASHICLLVVDADEGVTEQEAKLGQLIQTRGRALVVIANKWDLKDRGSATRRDFLEQVRLRFPHLAWADLLLLSAKTGRGTDRVWEAVQRANESHRMTVPTGQLNRWAREVWERNPPPMHKHRPVRFYYVTQTGTRPPTFQFFCNQPYALTESYKRYLLNQFRASFPGPGSPIRLVFKDRSGA
jgi:GTP-binding protein